MENKIKHITEQAALRGHEVRIRDISYAILQAYMNDSLIPYTVVFGQPEKDEDVTCYESLDSTKYLLRYLKEELAPKIIEKDNSEDIIKSISKRASQAISEDGSMSFEENREGIEQQLREIVELKKEAMTVTDDQGRPKTDLKTLALLQKTEADLRVKLNDKFGAAEKTESQYIFPTKRYDHICPWTRRECYQMTKEDAMKQWNLVEKI